MRSRNYLTLWLDLSLRCADAVADARRRLVPLARLERAHPKILHFECSASTNSTTGAHLLVRPFADESSFSYFCQIMDIVGENLKANRYFSGRAISSFRWVAFS